MRSVVLVSMMAVLAACADAPIDDGLQTDGLNLPDRAPDTTSGDASVPTNSSSGTTPAPAKFKLTVTVTGTGTVTSVPTGVTCSGTTCTGTFPKGTSVTLTPVPGTAAVFAAWSGACTGVAGCTASMAHDVAVGADFPSLDGAWAGSYTNTRPAGGCTFNNAGKLDVTIKATGAALASSGNVTGLELRNIPGCQLVGSTTGTAPDSAITLTPSTPTTPSTLTGTWTFAVQGAGGTLAFPFTAKVAGKTMTGSWTCPSCSGSFTLTKP